MQAAVLRDIPGPLHIEDVQISKPGPREVLIRTAVAGLCHSDLHFMEGKYPHPVPAVLGHESAGVVEAVGDQVVYVKPGDHVITCLSVYCGNCEACLTGHLSICPNKGDTARRKGEEPRLKQNGGPMQQFLHLSSFAEQMLVHEHALVKVREDMPLDRAALLGCAVVTGLGAVFHTARVEPGSTVAVVGCGGIGLSAIQGARIAGAGRIIAVDVVPSKLELAKKMGATDALNARELDPVAAIKDLTSGGVHYSFEAIGTKATAEQCFFMLRPGGTATIIGMIPVNEKIELPGHAFLPERKIQGSMMGSNRFRVDMPRFVDLYLDGRLDLDSLISARIGLEQINDGFTAMKTGEVARSVIVF
ncbi:MAG TPA: Zn-dependent alcohol dehydrogenase [Thermoanaerobaculia bacterium]|nr:Zn-dependent alcohol dehydrogenase [Thermoanaerobaculia bacterium]